MAAHQLRLGALRRQVGLAAALALALPAAVAVANTAELPLRGTAQGEAGSPSPSLRLDSLQPRLHGYAGCNRVSGAWVFRGTRVPVAALFENLEDGAQVSQFVEWFPGVTLEQVRSVLEHAARSALAPV